MTHLIDTDIIDVDRSLMDIFTELETDPEGRDMTLGDLDLLIAATALSHNLVPVTNNV